MGSVADSPCSGQTNSPAFYPPLLPTELAEALATLARWEVRPPRTPAEFVRATDELAAIERRFVAATPPRFRRRRPRREVGRG